MVIIKISYMNGYEYDHEKNQYVPNMERIHQEL